MKSVLHLAMNLVIVAVYVFIGRDYFITFSNKEHVFESITEVIITSLMAATLLIYASYTFDGTKSHRTQFSLLILGVSAGIYIVDKLIL